MSLQTTFWPVSDTITIQWPRMGHFTITHNITNNIFTITTHTQCQLYHYNIQHNYDYADTLTLMATHSAE